MCKFLLTCFIKNITENSFAKLVKSVSLCQRLSKKLKIIKIWQLKVGQSIDYSLLQEKAVIQAVSIKARF